MTQAVISISETNIFTVVKALIDSLGLNNPPVNPPAPTAAQVIRAPVNRAPTPPIGFIALTPGKQKRLSTNVNSYQVPQAGVLAPGTIGQMMPTEWTIQVDCYGPAAGDWAAIIKNIWRSEYAVDFMSLGNSGFDLAPLYAEDAMQMPLVSGEDQYEERWTFPVALQSNPIVTLVQQFPNVIGPVNLVNVDRTYKG